MRCRHVQRALILLTLTLFWLPSVAATKRDSSALGIAHDSTWLDQSMNAADVRHFIGRTGFGLTLTQLDELSGKTRAAAIDWLMRGFKREPEILMPQWVNAAAPRYWVRHDLDNSDKRRFQYARDHEIGELRQWWVSNILQTSSPQTERMVLFWHDHFATSYHGVNRQSTAMARQNQTFRQMGMGSYRDLLKAMIRDPALLYYLNNINSKKGKPNENLARELLELFTLGEGNYSENTVKEAARSLTGYAVSQTHNLSFQLQKWKQDEGPKTLFGIRGNHDGDALVDIILSQPEAAEFLAKKFWHSFVSDSTPVSKTIETWALEFEASDFDVATLYRSVISSKEFWAKSNRSSLVKSPVTLLLGTARTLDYPKRNWQQFYPSLAGLGMDLFAPPDVSGWSEGASFVTPGRLLDRYQAVQMLLSKNEETGVSSNDMKNISESSTFDISKQLVTPVTAQKGAMKEASAQGDSMQGGSGSTASISPGAGWSASEARVQWASFNPENSQLILDVSLEDVHTPDRDYYTVSFRINSTPDMKLEIRMNSFDCWPSCFDPWPDCAWIEEDYPDMKTLSFSLEAPGDNDKRCHYDNLSMAEQQLVTALWNSLPEIVEHVRLSIRGKERFAEELGKWHTVLNQYASDLATNRYNTTDGIFIIDSAFARIPTTETVISSPSVTYTSVDALATALQARRLGLFDILLSGIDADSFPELSGISELPSEQQLKLLLKHPIYQVY